jgi:hypothetical protein
MSNLPHYLIKAIRLDLLDALLLINIIHGNSFVLQGKEEEQHLVYLLLVPGLFLLVLLHTQSLLLQFNHEVNSSVSQHILGGTHIYAGTV